MNNGGPAFPVPTGSGFVEGMTLRDYFAGQALIGYMLDCSAAYSSDQRDEAASIPEYAREAYRIADAMLAEREKL